MEPIYTQEFEITDLYVDCRGRLLPSKILFLMQEVAGTHFSRLSMDYESLAQRGLFWAITRNKVQITRLPMRGEIIRLETWPMPTTRVAYPRSIVAYDQKGNEVFRSITLWVLMDIHNRSMILPGKSGIEVSGTLRGNATLAFVENGGDNWLLWLFDTDTLAPIALLIGIVLIMFIKTKKAKTIGDIAIGFGILFVGLMNMTGAVKDFADNPAFMDLLAGLADKPVMGILAGLVITVIVQSSSATVAMLQSLAVTGALNFAGVYPIVMGINIGTTLVTAFYCFLGGESRDSKRTGVVHLS